MPSRRRRNSLSNRLGGGRVVAALLVLLAPAAAAAQGGVDAAGSPPCLAAAATAEAEWNLPTGVLAAIGRVESGRWDPGTRQVVPWPWTANVAGDGRYYASRGDAIADVARERMGGARSVDVGCFQVNLMHHPNAFASLDEAFDPLANARYAARFLTALRANAGAWDLAVGQYHSAVPEIGGPYRERVMSALDPQARPGTTGVQALRTVPASSNSARFATSADPYVILVRSSLMLGRTIRRDAPADPHVIRIRG